MKYINREEYLDFLLAHKDKHVIKVVSGVRRCGKSTLFSIYIDYLINDLKIDRDQVISINFEDIYYSDKQYKEVYEYIRSKIDDVNSNKRYYIFLDEIQNLDKFEKMVDSLFLLDNVDIYLTGSNAYFMSSEIATLLSGRYVELKMLPLSFKEYVDGRKEYDVNTIDTNKSLNNYYYDYIRFSSFPFALQYGKDENAIYDYLRSIYNTIILKDVVQRYKITDVSLLEKVASYLFDNIGNRINNLNISNILNSYGNNTNDKTINKYVKALVDSLIFYEAKRFNIKGKQFLNTQSKFYCVDLGLRNLICKSLKVHDEGRILENVVFLELIRRGYEVRVGQVNSSSDSKEIDFVATKNNDTLFIQVCLSIKDENTYSREITPLKSLNNSYSKMILTMDEAPIRDDDGIKIINCLEWLLG